MKRLMCLILAVTVSVTSFWLAGCGGLTGCGKKQTDDENSLIIEFYEAGYGRNFIDNMVTAFKEKNPGKNIYINASSDGKKIRTELSSGPRIVPTDLYFSGDIFFDLLAIGSTEIDGVRYDSLLADLSDVYSATIPGEKRTIEDKMQEQYKDYAKFNDKYYTVPWAGGMGGLVYNKKIFDTLGLKIPRTTNELFEVCDVILEKDKAIKPFLYCGADPYWDFVYDVWFAQYEGLEGFEESWNGKYYDTVREKYVFGSDVAALKGKYEAMSVMQTALNQIADDGPIYTDHKSNAYTFTEAQMNFLLGKAAMMPNGDWLENEMSEFSGDLEMAFMPVPVISSLGEKLGITEQQLRQAIDFIDKVPASTKPDIPQEKIDSISSARSIVKTIGVNHNVVIPAYSNAIPLAKDFLRFMLSDEGLKIYFDSTKGATMPFSYDYESLPTYSVLSSFQKSKFAILDDAYMIFNNVKNPLYYKGGLSVYSNIASWGRVESLLSAENKKDKKTAYDIYNENIGYVRRNWTTILTQAGLQQQ